MMQINQTILIVDDLEANLLALEQTLFGIQADLIKASNGPEALSLSLNHDFALAILDVQMPAMDGYELASLLRSDPENASIPIIFLTARSRSADQVFMGYQSGAVDYLIKPYDPDILRSKVSVFLELDKQKNLLQWERSMLEQRVLERTAEIEKKNIQLQEEIIERKKKEEALHLAGVVLDSILDGVMVTDSEERIISVNPAFTRITGFAAEEVIGKAPRIFSSEHYDLKFFDDIGRELNRHGQWAGEVWNRTKDGGVYPTWMSIVAITDEQGNVTRYVHNFRDQTQELEYKKRLNFLAYYDALTKLPNRELLLDRIDNAIARSQRNDTKIALLFLDLDRFKTVNDTLGHSFGDKLLAFAANQLRDCVRRNDTVARFGGDEFMVVIEDVHSISDATDVAEKILSNFNTTPYINAGNELFINFSIGISLYPDNGETAEALLKLSDTAMYRAKAAGRAGYRFYSEDMSSQFQNQLRLETDLKYAVNNKELFLLYQPQVDTNSGHMIGCEALVRWQHPKYGLLTPDRFITIAEETGLIHPVGEWILSEAISQAKLWRNTYKTDLRVSINFSSLQLLEPHCDRLLELTSSILTDNDLRMEIEITESVFLMRNESVIDTLHKFREAGFSISIDDFGTGYSCLAYLKRLPIDKLKVAMPFVQDIVSNPDDAAIATTIVQMGHTLRMGVIAEGVETQDQYNFLRELGCDEIQGYLFSRPRPADEIDWLLANGGRFELAPANTNPIDSVAPDKVLIKTGEERFGSPS
jgi:diguanylate cyclase (GGDEF)-like protein/PAS domain S-box-containing protein